jgi:hypothetical protein
VRVVVRIRPMQPSEESKGHTSVVRPIQSEKGSEIEVFLSMVKFVMYVIHHR